jgi:hypothetical protein
MRYAFGALALVAAMVIVGYSATVLFTAAWAASAEPWQQLLAGSGAAAIVLWEATALFLIGGAWHRGYRPVAVMSTLLLIVACVVTLTWEGKLVVGGQADKQATRIVDAKKLADIDNDLAWLRSRRQAIGDKTSTKAIRDELQWISSRVSTLETERGNAKAISEVNPLAALAARVSGYGTEQNWGDAFLIAVLVLWSLARVCAAPLAIAAMAGVKREAPAEKPKEAPEPAKPVPATPLAKITVPPAPIPPLVLREALDEEPRDPPPSGGKKITLAAVPEPAKAEVAVEPAAPAREVAFFDAGVNWDLVERLSDKDRRRIAREVSKKKALSRDEDEVSLLDIELWSSHFLRKGVPSQSVTSKEARAHILEYAEKYGYTVPHARDPRRLSSLINNEMSVLNGITLRKKQITKNRDSKGAVWHSVYLLPVDSLSNFRAKPMKVRA